MENIQHQASTRSASTGYIRNRNYCDVGTNIREIRKFRGMSTSKLGKLIGMDSPHVNRYERNERTPNIYTLMDIADALDVSLDALVGRAKVKGLDNEDTIAESLRLVKVKDIAAKAGVSDVTVRNYVRKMGIEYTKIERSWYCTLEQEEAILNKLMNRGV